MTTVARAPAQPAASVGAATQAALTPILVHLSRAATRGHPAGIAVALAALQTATVAQPLDRIDLGGLLALANLGLHDLRARAWATFLVPLSLRLWLSVRLAVIDATTHELVVSLVARDAPHAATRLAQRRINHHEAQAADVVAA